MMIRIIITLLLGFLILYKFSKSYQYLQQKHYHLNDYYKYVIYYYKNNYWDLLLIINPIVNNLFINIISIIFIILMIYLNIQKRVIIKLKYTKRIIRLFLTTILLISIIYMFFNNIVNYLILINLFSPIIAICCLIINYPMEYIISYYYQRKSIKKLNKIKPIIIGITGSYGKTSTKEFLYEMLKADYRSIKSPASYNTINGIALTINNYLDDNCNMLVLELGASKVNDLKRTLKYIKLNHAIVTEVGLSHLSTFKSVENIVKEKMKVIESLKEEGIGIINIDNSYIRNYQGNYKSNIITIGINYQADYQAFNINISNNLMNFKIKHLNNIYEISTKLIGYHNIYNILSSFAMAIELKCNINKVKDAIYDLTNPNHRLSLTNINGIKIIDDSYNSNIVGFMNALETLNLISTKKAIITSGIVETGKMEKEINKKIALKMVEICDVICLIDSKVSIKLQEELINLDCNKFRVFKNLFKAIDYLLDNNYELALLENDLPDCYYI